MAMQPKDFAKLLYDTSAGCAMSEASAEYVGLHQELVATEKREARLVQATRAAMASTCGEADCPFLAEVRACLASVSASKSVAPRTVDILFDGPPEHVSPRFVECEENGKSINLGTWVEREGGMWALRIEVAS